MLSNVFWLPFPGAWIAWCCSTHCTRLSIQFMLHTLTMASAQKVLKKKSLFKIGAPTEASLFQ